MGLQVNVKTLAAIQDKLKDLPRKRVFIYDSEDGQPFTAFEGYTTNILKLIGADNVMSGLGVDKTWAKRILGNCNCSKS